MFATNVEMQRIDDAGSSSPRNNFLSLSFVDLEIVIQKSSWIDRQDFPVFSHVLNCEIREFDFLAKPVFHTGTVQSLLFRSRMSAADRAEKS